MTLSGRCLCEAATYEIVGPARGVVNCHCSRCRRHTGHFMAATQAARGDVIISGSGLETIYRDYASDYHVFDESIPNHGEGFPGATS